MPICPNTMKSEFIVPVTETPHLVAAVLRPFDPGRQNFNTRFEFGLYTPLKFYPDPLRFAGVIRKKSILSKYNTYYAVMRIYAWQRTEELKHNIRSIIQQYL